MHKCKTSKAKIAVMAGLAEPSGFWRRRACKRKRHPTGTGMSAACRNGFDYGVLLGYENGDYGPDRPATRAQITTFLDRIMGYQYSAKNTFTDS